MYLAPELLNQAYGKSFTEEELQALYTRLSMFFQLLHKKQAELKETPSLQK
jgi:hypothetical protein